MLHMVGHWLLLAVLLKQVRPNATSGLFVEVQPWIFLILSIQNVLFAAHPKVCEMRLSSWAVLTPTVKMLQSLLRK